MTIDEGARQIVNGLLESYVEQSGGGQYVPMWLFNKEDKTPNGLREDLVLRIKTLLQWQTKAKQIDEQKKAVEEELRGKQDETNELKRKLIIESNKAADLQAEIENLKRRNSDLGSKLSLEEQQRQVHEDILAALGGRLPDVFEHAKNNEANCRDRLKDPEVSCENRRAEIQNLEAHKKSFEDFVTILNDDIGALTSIETLSGGAGNIQASIAGSQAMLIDLATRRLQKLRDEEEGYDNRCREIREDLESWQSLVEQLNDVNDLLNKFTDAGVSGREGGPGGGWPGGGPQVGEIGGEVGEQAFSGSYEARREPDPLFTLTGTGPQEMASPPEGVYDVSFDEDKSADDLDAILREADALNPTPGARTGQDEAGGPEEGFHTTAATFEEEKRWIISASYSMNDVVEHYGSVYVCILGHTASRDDEPGFGLNWETYWRGDAEEGGGSVKRW